MGIIATFLDRVVANRQFTPEDVALSDRLAWVNDDDSNTLDDYPSPSWSAETYNPDPWAENFHRGFTLALEGEDPAIPAGLPGHEARAFEAGVVAGTRRREEHQERERIDYELWLDELAAEARLDGEDEHHACEVVEAIGAVEARKACPQGWSEV